MNQSTDFTSAPKPRNTVSGLLFGFLLLLFAGSLVQTMPLYALVLYLLSPAFQTAAEDLAAGKITPDQITAVFEKLTIKVAEHPLALVASLVGTMGVIGVCILWSHCVKKQSLAFLGMRKKHAASHYLSGIVIGFAMFAAAIGISVLSGAATVRKADSINLPYILLFLFGFLIQGFEEELLLRGYLLNSLRTTTSRFKAVFLSSLVFALLHIGNSGVTFLALLNITLFGIFAGIYFIRTNSIWGVAAIHSVWNFVQGNFWGCSVSGMPTYDSFFVTELTAGRDLTHGGIFGPEGGLAVTIVLVTGIFLLLWTALPAKKKG